MKIIIVPVDFSTTSTNAAEFAGNLAAFYGAEIWLYHAYQIPIALSEFAYPVVDIAEMQKAAVHELDVLKENTQNKLRRTITINTRAEMNVLQLGLNNLCDELKPDMVVMGLSGKNALTRLIVGSNTIKTVYNLYYPILVVPPKAEFIPVRKIGFACDYREIEKTTPVTLLKKIVTDFHAELHVMNVDHNNNNPNPGKANESLLMNNLLRDTKAEFHSIEAGEITDGINWFIDKSKLDWLVVIPKKHKLLEKVFRRSHTKELVYHTHIPVLCIHE
ncbi:MAG: universal stress protein [Ferruginibacter sp.]|nr:universal stress protein [Ferruginibacter sp.]